MKTFFIFLGLILCLAVSAHANEVSLELDQDVLDSIYSGQEAMHFSISWSGGIKIGDLHLSVTPNPSGVGFLITARVTDYGLFKFFYPVDDTFITAVQGPLKLPVRYDVHQIEGGDMDVRRLTLYNQQNFSVMYQKNTNPPLVYVMGGQAYNEFSSFFITRALQIVTDKMQIVPTFVDDKRHKVAVKIFGVEPRNSIFGRINTIKVMPLMNFKGLYDKDGDTVFWITDDNCRIPVEIESQIAIGSLVAELVEYSNPACLLKPAE